jgi:hypothetical protein
MYGKSIYKIINKMNWTLLSENPNAIHILEQNLDKIDWNGSTRIFQYSLQI